MDNKKKPNIQLLIIIGIIIVSNLLVIVAALLGNGGLTISLMGFNLVFIFAVYFIFLSRRNSRYDDVSHDDDNSDS